MLQKIEKKGGLPAIGELLMLEIVYQELLKSIEGEFTREEFVNDLCLHSAEQAMMHMIHHNRVAKKLEILSATLEKLELFGGKPEYIN